MVNFYVYRIKNGLKKWTDVPELWIVQVKEKLVSDGYIINEDGEFTEKGKYLGTLGILGGEPLIHPQFIELCIAAREYLPYSRIRVTTNGLLLNKLNKRDLCILRRFDIEILISKYREEDDFDAMAKLLEEYKIVYKFTDVFSIT